MTDNEKVMMGDKAEKLLNNAAFDFAIERIKFNNFSSFCNLKPDDIEGMKLINLKQAALDDLERELKDIVIDGNNAKNK